MAHQRTNYPINNNGRRIQDYWDEFAYDREEIEWNGIAYDMKMTEAVIPDGITEIPEAAFYERYKLTSVYIPDSVTAIGQAAFMNCKSLKEIHIPNSVKRIGVKWGRFLNYDYGAFSGCSSLERINIPDGVEEIAQDTFSFCTNLQSVNLPESITSIGASAFMRCEELTSICIPEGVTYIGEYAFAGCSRLKSISLPDSVKYIGEGAFADTPWLDQNSDEWLIIGSVLLRYQGTEQEVVIPDTITSISAEAFAGCTELTGITIPNSVTSIGMGAFRNCRKLKSITIPEGVKDFGFTESERYFTLEGCSSLTSVTVRNITLNTETLNHFRKLEGNDPLSSAIVLIANHYQEGAFYGESELLGVVLWTVFALYPDDEKTLAHIKENFHWIFPSLLDMDNAELLQKVIDDRKYIKRIKRRNIDIYIAYTINRKLPRMQQMLETYKEEHLGRRKKRR